MQLLIYNNIHWFDKLSMSEQIAKNIDGKFNSRYKKGDVIDVKPDGFWVDENDEVVRGYNPAIFRVIECPEMSREEAEVYLEQSIDESNPKKVKLKLKRKYSLDLDLSTVNTHKKFKKSELKFKDKEAPVG